MAWTDERALSPVAYARQVVRELLVSPSPLAASCFQARDIGSCSTLLDLDFPQGAEREAWIREVYPSARLRYELVGEDGLIWSGAFGLQQRELCQARPPVEGSEQDQACTQVAANAVGTRAEPVNSEVRANLFRTALRLGGGTPALERIERLPADASPRQVIEAAAERSADEVVAIWLDNLSADDSGRGRMPNKSGLFWAGCFAAFALRSTRWRLG